MNQWNLHQASLGYLEVFFAPSGILRIRTKTRAPDAHVTSTGKLFGNDVRAQITEMKGISDSNVATYVSPQDSPATSIVPISDSASYTHLTMTPNHSVHT